MSIFKFPGIKILEKFFSLQELSQGEIPTASDNPGGLVINQDRGTLQVSVNGEYVDAGWLTISDPITSDGTINGNRLYPALTDTAGFTQTLPENTAYGVRYAFFDPTGSWVTNNFTVTCPEGINGETNYVCSSARDIAIFMSMGPGNGYVRLSPLQGAGSGLDADFLDGMDSDHFLQFDRGDQLTLPQLADTLSATPRDLFIYDTTKDSDGGEWRHRCQDLSWYNEALNTATRGERKEFPAVAIIVAESDKVSIYDADTSDLNLWMSFTAGVGLAIGYNDLTCVTAMNGKLYVGSGTYDLWVVDFLKDQGYSYSATNIAVRTNSIEKRNAVGTALEIESAGLIARDINDVAVTVLDDSRVDEETGLSIPTVVVATGSGVSIIRNNTAVVDLGSSEAAPEAKTVDVMDGVLITHTNNTVCYQHELTAINNDDVYYNANALGRYYGGSTPSDKGARAGISIPDGFVSQCQFSDGIAIMDASKDRQDNGMVAYIAEDYATGWLPGDVKLAAIMGTDATARTFGQERITNGTFDTDTAGWAIEAAITATVINGELHLSRDGAVVSPPTRGMSQTVSVTPGRTYVLMIDIVDPSQDVYVGLDGSWVTYTEAGNFYRGFKATDTSTSIEIWVADGAPDAVINTISLWSTDEDRSDLANGLLGFGTLLRSPVEAGAELTDYHGWSTSNYLRTHSNNFPALGADDFCFLFWTKNVPISGGRTLFEIVHESTTLSSFGVSSTGVSILLNGATRFYNNPSANNLGWVLQGLVRRNGVLYYYVDGQVIATDPDAGDVLEAGTLYLGVNNTRTNPWNSPVALFRVMASAPSDEQLKKIYIQEKALFQENAAATLYGSDGEVTAVTFDDTTKALHIGTSAGRSVFQGLRRVENTTAAISAAIAAVNDLVVEG